MYRLSRDGLQMAISIALKVQPGYVKTLLKNTHVHDVLVADLVRRIMGAPESEAIILKPDLVGPSLSPRPGKWDLDEPHPHPDLKAIDHG